MRPLLVAGAWLWAAAIVGLSLAPTSPQVGGLVPDKLAHFVAYAVLMACFCLLYRGKKARLAYGVLWIGMGVAVEFAQATTTYRSFELADMAANALGVAAGAAAALILPKVSAAGETGTR